MTDAILEVRDLTTSFNGFRAVDGASFDVRRGTITGLIGPNGAGKSTVFNSVVGITRPHSGTIRLKGRRIDRLGPDAVFMRGLAHTFQIPRPFPQMSVLENLMLSATGQAGESFIRALLAPGKVATQEAAIRDRAMEVLTFVTLDRLAGHAAGTLSGGQTKLLELARVLMSDPEIVLLDEPGAGVNPTLTRLLIQKIEALNERGVTFFVIEHDMDFIMRHCDPIIAMGAGKVIFEGTAEAAQNNPTLLDAYLGRSVDA